MDAALVDWRADPGGPEVLGWQAADLLGGLAPPAKHPVPAEMNELVTGAVPVSTHLPVAVPALTAPVPTDELNRLRMELLQERAERAREQEVVRAAGRERERLEADNRRLASELELAEAKHAQAQKTADAAIGQLREQAQINSANLTAVRTELAEEARVTELREQAEQLRARLEPRLAAAEEQNGELKQMLREATELLKSSDGAHKLEQARLTELLTGSRAAGRSVAQLEAALAESQADLAACKRAGAQSQVEAESQLARVGPMELELSAARESIAELKRQRQAVEGSLIELEKLLAKERQDTKQARERAHGAETAAQRAKTQIEEIKPLLEAVLAQRQAAGAKATSSGAADPAESDRQVASLRASAQAFINKYIVKRPTVAPWAE